MSGSYNPGEYEGWRSNEPIGGGLIGLKHIIIPFLFVISYIIVENFWP